MTEIYIIRHVQAEGNLYRMMQGHWDGDVTELGRRQMEALSRRFSAVKIDALYSSDLFRAKFTASAITRCHNIPMQIDPRLKEINVGPWETSFFGDVAWHEPELMRLFTTDQENFYLEGAESYHDVRKRAVEAIYEIAEANDGRTVALTSHGITIRCMLTGILGLPLNDTDTVPIFQNTGVAHLFYENGKFTADYLNDFSHLGADIPLWNPKMPMLRHEHVDPRDFRDYYIACYKDSWLNAHGDLAGFDAETYYSSAVSHFSADGSAVTVIYDGEAPIGLLDLDTVRGSHAGYGWISLLYLDAGHRKKGLGIQLLGQAIAKYESMGRSSIRLNAAEDNVDALRFYERWGFRRLSSVSGANGRLFVMERKLRGSDYGTL